MTDGAAGLSYEQLRWLTVVREIEDLLLRGFTGEIALHCAQGVVEKYHVKEIRKPGEDRRTG